MSAFFWVEELDDRHRLVARHRLTGPTAHLGRGYDNDLVLDDPSLAARHLTVCPQPQNQFTVHPLPGIPVYLEGTGKRLEEETTVDGHDILVLGDTRLRLRGAEHPIAPPVTIQPPRFPGLLVTATIFAVALLIYAVSDWTYAGLPEPLWRHLSEQWFFILVAGVWITLWSLVNHLLYGRTNVDRHARATALGLLGLATVVHLPGPLAFGLSIALPEYLKDAGFSVVFAALALAHLRVFDGEPLLAISRSGAVILLLTALGVAGFNGVKDDGNVALVAATYPPGLRMVGLEGLEDTMLDLEKRQGEGVATLSEPMPSYLY